MFENIFLCSLQCIHVSFCIMTVIFQRKRETEREREREREGEGEREREREREMIKDIMYSAFFPSSYTFKTKKDMLLPIQGNVFYWALFNTKLRLER